MFIPDLKVTYIDVVQPDETYERVKWKLRGLTTRQDVIKHTTTQKKKSTVITVKWGYKNKFLYIYFYPTLAINFFSKQFLNVTNNLCNNSFLVNIKNFI